MEHSPIIQLFVALMVNVLLQIIVYVTRLGLEINVNSQSVSQRIPLILLFALVMVHVPIQMFVTVLLNGLDQIVNSQYVMVSDRPIHLFVMEMETVLHQILVHANLVSLLVHCANIQFALVSILQIQMFVAKIQLVDTVLLQTFVFALLDTLVQTVNFKFVLARILLIQQSVLDVVSVLSQKSVFVILDITNPICVTS